VNRRSLLGVVCLAAIVMTLLSQPKEAYSAFADVNDAYWAKASILRLADKNLIEGEAGIFQPLRPITRAEYIKMVVMIMGLHDGKGLSKYNNFSDVTKEDWYYPYVHTALHHQLIKGKDENRFDPHALLTREEMAVIVSRLKNVSDEKSNGEDPVLSFSDAHTISPWARSAIAAAVRMKLITGYPNRMFLPNRLATRAEAASLLDRMAYGEPPALKEKVVTVGGKAVAYLNRKTVRATAYGPFVGSRTATGKRVRFGMVAVDPKVIPLGTKLYVTGYDSPLLPKGGFMAIAEDTGGAVKGDKIDIFINQPRKTLLRFGVQKVQVYIIKE
jgi:3D (Asp-Asp-Asp) domain-containing protein